MFAITQEVCKHVFRDQLRYVDFEDFQAVQILEKSGKLVQLRD